MIHLMSQIETRAILGHALCSSPAWIRKHLDDETASRITRKHRSLRLVGWFFYLTLQRKRRMLTAAPCLAFLRSVTVLIIHPGALNVPREEANHHPTPFSPPPIVTTIDMTFDWLSRFRKPRDARGQYPQRPPVMIARPHGKRAVPIPQARAQVRRPQHHPPVLVPRPAAPMRKPVGRPPSRPHPAQRDPMQCLHLHFHPNHKRDLALPPLRQSKHMGSPHAPPLPPPRGALRAPGAPPRHVHWAPAQAPLPNKPYPYPSQASTVSQPRGRPYQSPVPRYQPPRSASGVAYRRR